jgi:hypothetical protein
MMRVAGWLASGVCGASPPVPYTHQQYGSRHWAFATKASINISSWEPYPRPAEYSLYSLYRATEQLKVHTMTYCNTPCRLLSAYFPYFRKHKEAYEITLLSAWLCMPPACFVSYGIRLVSMKHGRSVLPRTSCFKILQFITKQHTCLLELDVWLPLF